MHLQIFIYVELLSRLTIMDLQGGLFTPRRDLLPMEGFIFNLYVNLQGPTVHISSGYKLACVVITRVIWSGKREPYPVVLVVCMGAEFLGDYCTGESDIT